MHKGDFEEWKRHPATEAWFKSLEEEQIELAMQVGSGVTLSKDVGETALKTAEMVGIGKGIDRARSHVPEWAKDLE